MVMILLASCGKGSPSDPITNFPGSVNRIGISTGSSSHHLLGFYLIKADTVNRTFEMSPVRCAVDHMNVVGMLEKHRSGPYFKITGSQMAFDGTWLLDISVTNPFSSLDFTAFDVRGIVMFPGERMYPESGVKISDRNIGEGELLNADGFTALYNSTTSGNGLEGYLQGVMASDFMPDSTVNGFKRHVTVSGDNSRNALYAGDVSVVSYNLSLPNGILVFGYGVDANWSEPLDSPVDDPMTDFGPEANCPESWKIKIEEIPLGGGLTSEGGSTILQIDIFDLQGKDEATLPLVECPELFDGTVEAEWVADGPGYTRYEAVIGNPKGFFGGKVRCLIRKEAAENDAVNKPWLDLSAWQVIDVHVEPVVEPGDITPNLFEFGNAYANQVCVEAGYAYVADDYEYFQVFDISDPINPVWVCRADSGETKQFTVRDGLLYEISDDNGWFNIYDIDLPTIERIAYAETRDFNSFTLSGDYCYLTQTRMLYIMNIENPSAMYVVDVIELPHRADSIIVENGYAYLYGSIYGKSHLQIVDIDPLSVAHLVKIVNLSSGYKDMTIVDGYLYTGKEIIDIDPPETAHNANLIPESLGETMYWNGWLVTGNHGLKFYDISSPEFPECLYTLPLENYGITRFDIENGYAWLAEKNKGLSVADITPVESAHIVRTIKPVDGGILAAGGDALYVMSSDLHVFDISSPALIHETSSWPDIGGKMQYDNGYLYIADDNINIYDAGDPDDISLASTVELANAAGPYKIDDGMLYASYYYSNGYYNYGALCIVDISNPAEPIMLGSMDMASIRQIGVDGDYACTWEVRSGYTSNSYHFKIISLTDPDAPEVVASYGDTFFDHADDIEMYNGYAFVLADYDYIRILDIDPPDEASIIDTIYVSDPARLFIQNDILYITGSTDGLIAVDITDPENWEITAVYEEGADMNTVAINDGYAYMTGWSGNGIRVARLW